MKSAMNASPVIKKSSYQITTSYDERGSTTYSEEEPLSYEILCCSSISGHNVPENILVDCPHDEDSRWTSGSNAHPQYLILKLKRPAVVKKIKFGKYKRKHHCNMEDFEVYGGLDEYRMVLLLEGKLNNDNVPQLFNLRHHSNNRSEYMPITYLKIQPTGSRASLFNYSIWYVELLGQDDPMYTSMPMGKRQQSREQEIVRLCLKHFRQQGYNSAFAALQAETNVKLEHPSITALHESLVELGDFTKTEALVEQYIGDGLMDEYLSMQPVQHNWRLLTQQPCARKPGIRGGHQMVVDSEQRLIYLFGGWRGTESLGDLWVYDIVQAEWTLLCEYDAEKPCSPTPRACHRMIFDPVSKCIFMLGRHLYPADITVESVKSNFYRYDTKEHRWHRICEDTSALGGPKLLHSHQMCIDVKKRTIYVFGGRIIDARRFKRVPELSGLFSYNIEEGTWQEIPIRVHNAYETDTLALTTDCTMVFNHASRQIYFLCGKSSKDQNYDFITYDVDYDDFSFVQRLKSVKNKCAPVLGSMVGFTYRITIDCERKEIYIFSTFKKAKDRRDIDREQSNSLWVYSLEQNTWSRVFYSQHTIQADADADCASTGVLDRSQGASLEPCPRYAHQLVYDDVGKTHYLFGGNPGIATNPNLRLGDFWALTLKNPTREKLLQHCRFLLRKLRYEELIPADPKIALMYLRTSISAVIDHSDSAQVASFHKLPGLLFGLNASHADCNDNEKPSSAELINRREFIFNKLIQMLPSTMVQPESNLSDFIVI